MAKKKKTKTVKEYLIVKCIGLNDQYECDADRTPIYVCEHPSKEDWENEDLEIYEIYTDGSIKCIKEWEG